MAKLLSSAWVPSNVPSAFYSPILPSPNAKEVWNTYTPKRLPRQCHISTRIDIQLIRPRIPTPLSRRHIRLAVIRRARRPTRVNDLDRNRISYAANRAPNTTSVRHGIALATIPRRAAWMRPACDGALATTI